mmetsp:Transcript_15249/g.36780  ORF Transcript_15249/g.36780 Transcript_15249/m.36780 type:complete len:270 (+) Transcript_15249:11-820(+)
MLRIQNQRLRRTLLSNLLSTELVCICLNHDALSRQGHGISPGVERGIHSGTCDRNVRGHVDSALCTTVVAKHRVPQPNRQHLMSFCRRMEAIKFAQKGPVKLRSNAFHEWLGHHSHIRTPSRLQLGLPILSKFVLPGIQPMNVSVQHLHLGAIAVVDATSLVNQLVHKLTTSFALLNPVNVAQIKGGHQVDVNLRPRGCHVGQKFIHLRLPDFVMRCFLHRAVTITIKIIGHHPNCQHFPLIVEISILLSARGQKSPLFVERPSVSRPL